MSALEQLIPKGYKTSEVGIIPERWNAIPAKEVVEFFGGYGFSSRLASNDGTKWLKIANVGINEIEWDAVSYLPEYLLKSFKEYSLAENDVVMALTRPLLGDQLKVAKIDSKDLPALLNQRVAKLKPKSSTNLNYIYYSIQREDFIAAMNLKMAGTDPPNIGTNALGKIFVALPEDEKEQTAIANALSDVDALLTELEKLIAKKQAIKTATMQQLLTGKTRLPQFATYIEGEKQGQLKGTKPSELGEIPEDWDVHKIGTLFNITAGGDLKKNQFSPIRTDKHPYPIYSNAITNKGLYGYCSTFDYSGEYLTITARGGIGHATERDESFCAIGRLLVLSPKQNTNCKYVAEFANQYIEFANESTGVPQLTAPQVAKYNVAMPVFEEQIAIANILSDMDNEIQTLEQRLAKTRQIKQGMMQELLTGRTRLPFDKEQ
jgi:type I restriction enzyme S subunit